MWEERLRAPGAGRKGGPMSALQKLAVANDLGTSAGLLPGGEKPRSSGRASRGPSGAKVERAALDSRGSIISQLSRLSFMVGTEYGGNFSKSRPPGGLPAAPPRAGLSPSPGTSSRGPRPPPGGGAGGDAGGVKKPSPAGPRAVTPLVTRPHFQ